MEKLNQLTDHLRHHVPGLRNNPDALVVFAENGQLDCHHQSTLNFGYRFNAVLIFSDLGCHTDFVFVPLLDWIRQHETELPADGVRFMATPLDGERYDLRIELPLSQRVMVTANSHGQWTTEHPPEPQPDWRGDFPALASVSPAR